MKYTFIVSLFLFSGAFSETILIPGDYNSIQLAIDAASNGDSLIVSPGTYSENIDFLEKYPHEVTFKDGYKHGLEIYYGFQIEYGQGPLYDKGELDDHSPKRDIPHRDEITWSNGRIHGLFRKYDYEGNLWIEEIYEEGFIKQYNYYNDNLGWRTAPPNGNLV